MVRCGEHVLDLVEEHGKPSRLSILAAQDRRDDHVAGATVGLRHLKVLGSEGEAAVQEDHDGHLGARFLRHPHPRFEPGRILDFADATGGCRRLELLRGWSLPNQMGPEGHSVAVIVRRLHGDARRWNRLSKRGGGLQKRNDQRHQKTPIQRASHETRPPRTAAWLQIARGSQVVYAALMGPAPPSHPSEDEIAFHLLDWW